MLELTGFAAIAGVLTGSVLVSLFLGEAVIGWLIRAMDAGVKRADEAAKRLAGKPQTTRLLAAQRVRFHRVEVLPR
jgi:hypothetical protein